MEAAKVKDEEAVIEIKDEEDGLSVETALESGMLTTQVSTNQNTVVLTYINQSEHSINLYQQITSRRKSLSSIRKSFSLRQKKSFTSPLYVDINSQENL